MLFNYELSDLADVVKENTVMLKEKNKTTLGFLPLSHPSLAHEPERESQPSHLDKCHALWRFTVLYNDDETCH